MPIGPANNKAEKPNSLTITPVLMEGRELLAFESEEDTVFSVAVDVDEEVALDLPMVEVEEAEEKKKFETQNVPFDRICGA